MEEEPQLLVQKVQVSQDTKQFHVTKQTGAERLGLCPLQPHHHFLFERARSSLVWPPGQPPMCVHVSAYHLPRFSEETKVIVSVVFLLPLEHFPSFLSSV